MKTIADIKSEMADLERRNGELQFAGKPREKAKADKHYCFLKTCLYYLESVQPTEELLKKDIDLQESQIESIENGFAHWKTWNMGKCSKFGLKVEAEYHKEMNLPYYKNQLKTLKYLFND